MDCLKLQHIVMFFVSLFSFFALSISDNLDATAPLFLHSSQFPSDEVAAIFLLLLLMAVNERSAAQEATSKS